MKPPGPLSALLLRDGTFRVVFSDHVVVLLSPSGTTVEIFQPNGTLWARHVLHFFADAHLTRTYLLPALHLRNAHHPATAPILPAATTTLVAATFTLPYPLDWVIFPRSLSTAIAEDLLAEDPLGHRSFQSPCGRVVVTLHASLLLASASFPLRLPEGEERTARTRADHEPSCTTAATSTTSR